MIINSVIGLDWVWNALESCYKSDGHTHFSRFKIKLVDMTLFGKKLLHLFLMLKFVVLYYLMLIGPVLIPQFAC